mgnify:CR=1 FL=1
MQANNINHLTAWQHILQQAQVLAARLPEMGLNHDTLVLLPPLNDLVGVLAFLKQSYAEKEA